VGDQAWHTPFKPSPTGVGSYEAKRSGTHELHLNSFKNFGPRSI